MAQPTQKLNTMLWLQGMPAALDPLPLDQVRQFLLSRLRAIDAEIEELDQLAPSAGWLLQRVGEPIIALDAPEWDPLLYLEYWKSMRRAVVAALQML